MPMARGEIHIDTALSNLAREYSLPSLIADKISPRIPVMKDSDVYWLFGREEIRIKLDGEGDLKEAASPAVEFDWKPLGTAPYLCKTRAEKYTVPDSVVRNADNAVRPVSRTIEKLTYNLQLNRERRVAKLFTVGIAATSSPPVKWNTATADIEDDLRAAREVFRMSAGVYPNTIIMSAEVAGFVRLYLKASAELTYMDKVTISEVPARLWNMNVIVSSAMMNTAGEGLAEVTVPVWPDTVTLAYINPTDRPTMMDSSASWTFQSMPFRVRRWRDEEIEATIYEVTQCVSEHIVAVHSMMTLTDVLL